MHVDDEPSVLDMPIGNTLLEWIGVYNMFVRAILEWYCVHYVQDMLRRFV
jgi:hypothetical protein